MTTQEVTCFIRTVTRAAKEKHLLPRDPRLCPRGNTALKEGKALMGPTKGHRAGGMDGRCKGPVQTGGEGPQSPEPPGVWLLSQGPVGIVPG